MLDYNFDLKIVDFGMTAAIKNFSGNGRLSTYCGTPQYMAPEILQVDEATGKTTKSYSGHSVDIFAAGKILFVMVTGYFPFDIAVP